MLLKSVIVLTAIVAAPTAALAGTVALTKANVITVQYESSGSRCVVYINMGQQKNVARGDNATLGGRTGKIVDVYPTRAKAKFASPTEDDCASIKSWEAQAAKAAVEKAEREKKQQAACAKYEKKLKSKGNKVVKDEKGLGKCKADRRAKVVFGMSQGDGTYDSVDCGTWVCWKKAPTAGH
jgi:hypothetical protein